MLKRTLVFSSPMLLSLKNQQLLESAQVHIKRVKSLTPEKGHISVLSITDKQYSNIIHIWGAIEKKSKPTPLQLEFY